MGRGTSVLIGFALAIGGGIGLRFDQLPSQLLLDDEWHAVYRVVHDTPATIFRDFGHSDSSIPLTLLYYLESYAFGLSEIAMRWPLLVAGIATLVLFPWYIARRIGHGEALVFAALLAISPLLYFFSRMARPYALTLFLVYIAHVAFRRYVDKHVPKRSDAAVYATSAALAAWLHPVAVPFVVAPFVPAAWRWLRAVPAQRGPAFARLAVLALAAGIPMAALLAPPLLAHPESLTLKSGIDLPRADTLVAVWYEWFGTGSSVVLALCGAMAIGGTPVVWQRLAEARSMLAGVALCALLIFVTRPAWIGNPLTLARYLLPVLPLLLLATVCGALRLGHALAARITARDSRLANGIIAATAAVPLVALAATTPLAPVLSYPNANSLHALYEFDFRTRSEPVAAHMAGIPLSPWWATLAAHTPGTLTIAVAPFPLDSPGWDAPRWQASSRQRILSGFLTSLCPTSRVNEVPDDARFAFRNTVHLADTTALGDRHVDYVVWQKPYRYVAHGLDVPVAADVAPCGAAFEPRFGPPEHEDEWLAVYRVPRDADAQR